jgi:hypothetical protein
LWGFITEDEVYLTRMMTFPEKRAEVEVIIVEGKLAIPAFR